MKKKYSSSVILIKNIFIIISLVSFAACSNQVGTSSPGTETVTFSSVETVATIGGKPDGVTVTDTGTAYVTDIESGEIKKIDSDGTVTTISSDNFDHPDGITAVKVDNKDVLYVTDTGSGSLGADGENPYANNNDGVVKKVVVEDDGSVTISTIVDSTVLNAPTGIAADSSGNLYVADQVNAQVYKISFDNDNAQAPVPLVPEGSLEGPHGLALVNNADDSVSLVITDQGKNNIVKVEIPASGDNTNVTVTDVTPPSETGGFEDGENNNAKFKRPHGLAVGSNGAIFVADEENNRIRVITPSGQVNTVGGDGNAGDSDGDPASAQFQDPRGLGIDSSDDLYVCDHENGKVKKIK